MPHIHADGTVTDASATVTESVPDEEVESSPGTSSPASPRKRRTKGNANAPAPRKRAPTTDNP